MSADNWTTCPRCRDKRSDKLKLRLAEINAAYGKVPVEEFDQMRAAYEQEVARPAQATFREDYEFYGAEHGEVNASYRGSCTDCGLECKFEHTVPFYDKSRP